MDGSFIKGIGEGETKVVVKKKSAKELGEHEQMTVQMFQIQNLYIGGLFRDRFILGVMK